MKMVLTLPLCLISAAGFAKSSDFSSENRQACFEIESSIVAINQGAMEQEVGLCAKRGSHVVARHSTQNVDARAFNAFLIWRDGEGEDFYRRPVFAYPMGYSQDADQLTAPHEGIFFVSMHEYYTFLANTPRFVGTPTSAALVDGEILTDRMKGGVVEYRPRNGSRLVVHFSESSEILLNQLEAVEYCQQRGLRLPTARELFDFCAQDTTVSSDNYYFEHRCEESIWSASLWAENRDSAWAFYGALGVLSRKEKHSVRCVGRE